MSQDEDLPLHQRAEGLRQAGDLAHARSLIQEGLTRSAGVERGRLLAVLGRVNLDAGESAAATITLEEALGLCGDGVDAAQRGELLLDLGLARQRCGNLDGALEVLERAEDQFLEANRSQGRRRATAARGRVLYGRHDWEQARAAFREALEQAGEEPPRWRLEHALARTCERSGDHEQAERHYRAARESGWDGFSARPLDAGPAAALTASAGDALVDHDHEADLQRLVADMPPEDLRRLASLSVSLSSALSPAPLLELLLERALAWTAAERGYVAVCRPRPGGGPPRVEVRVARDRQGHPSASPEDEVSRAVVRWVCEHGQALFAEDLRADERLAQVAAASEGPPRSVAGLPLAAGSGPALGALYLEVRGEAGAFDAGARALLGALALQVALAWERSGRYERLADAYNETRRALEESTGAMFGLIGRARSMQQLLRAAEKLREHDAPLLLEGERGTGKELIARAIHRHSRRRQAPFVVESCASLPEGLVEAELMGHERGAFTGAAAARRGAFERAEGGTLYLDEVSAMSARMQALLLEVLETGQIRPLGAAAPRQVDCRIICASHEPLEEQVRKGRFREDLYFRLNVVRIEVPSLRHRREDLPALVAAFLEDKGRTSSELSQDALEAILSHDWPGNLRELRHALDRACTLAGSGQIKPRHLGLEGLRSSSGTRRLGRSSSGSQSAAKVEWNGYVLNRRQVSLLEHLQANGVATNREYVQLVNVSVPTGWRDLKDLLDKDLIRAEGQGRNTVYRLSESAPVRFEGRSS